MTDVMGAVMDDLDSTSATIGGLSVRMDRVETRLAHMERSLSSILAIVNQAKGGWRALVILGGIIGGIVGLFEAFRK